MAATKEQLNVQVPSDIRELAKTCAAAHRTSLNAWVAQAIEAQITKDRVQYRLDEMHKALRRVVKTYLPGKVATQSEMLAMAARVAAEDTREGFEVQQLAERTPARGTRARRRRTRAK